MKQPGEDKRYGVWKENGEWKFRPRRRTPESVKKKISEGRRAQLAAKWKAKAEAESKAVRAKKPTVSIPTRPAPIQGEDLRGYLRERGIVGRRRKRTATEHDKRNSTKKTYKHG
jgi:hypothetical protein